MQSRFFQSVPHAKGLPTKLTSHQVHAAAEEVFDLASEAINPLADAEPKYEALRQMLGQLAGTITQLEVAHRYRRYKAVREMRGVGGVDGKVGTETLSEIKRTSANERAKQMRHFRRMVDWHVSAEGGFTAEAKILSDLLSQRIKNFERLGYEESKPEFKYFINSVDEIPAALAAIATMGLSAVYDKMKSEHTAIQGVFREQTMLESKREARPKIKGSDRDVRHAVRMLLSTMHYDVEAGNPELEEVLGQIDEVIDRAGALGQRRETIDEKEAKKDSKKDPKADADKPDGSQNDQSGQDQTDSGNETPDSSDQQGQAAPDDQNDQDGQNDQSQTPQAQTAGAAESQTD